MIRDVNSARDCAAACTVFQCPDVVGSDHIAAYFAKHGFTRCRTDSCVFTKRSDVGIMYVVLYVDDLLLVSSSQVMLRQFTEQLADDYKITEFGQPTSYLGIHIEHKPNGIRLSQQAFAESMLARFGLADCNPVNTPLAPRSALSLSASDNEGNDDKALDPNHTRRYREVVGCLIYLTMASRPDLVCATGQLSRYMQAPRESHWQAAKRVLRYVKGTTNLGIAVAARCSCTAIATPAMPLVRTRVVPHLVSCFY